MLNGAFALGRNKRGSAKDRETAQAYLTLMRHGWGDEHFRVPAHLQHALFSRRVERADQGARGAATHGHVGGSGSEACAWPTDDIDVVDLLTEVSVPTLVLHSRYDNAVPYEEGQRLAAAMPNARFVALESENHVPMPDEPAWPAFSPEIEAFLRE